MLSFFMPQEIIKITSNFCSLFQKAFTYLISLKPAGLEGLVVLGLLIASDLRVNIAKESQRLFSEN